MIENNTELAEMISTRISHDLIGNIGALSSALELMNENNGEPDADAMNIIKTASQTLKARQTFFRIAFGLDTKTVKPEELKEICENYLSTVGSRSYPLTLNMNGVSAELVKVLCLSVMIGAEVCIRGGNIDIAVNKNNMVLKVSSEYELSAPKVAVYQNILRDIRPQDNISQYVQLIYLRELLGGDVDMQIEATAKTMTLVIG